MIKSIKILKKQPVWFGISLISLKPKNLNWTEPKLTKPSQTRKNQGKPKPNPLEITKTKPQKNI